MKFKQIIIISLLLLQITLSQSLYQIFALRDSSLFSNLPNTSDDEEIDSWTKRWNMLGAEAIGSIAFDSNEDLFLLGVTSNRQTDEYYNFLIKMNKSGDIIWQKWLDNNNFKIRYGYMKIDKYDNIYLLGSYKSENWLDFLILSKFDSSGDYLWNKTWGGYSAFWAYDMELDPLGNIYIAGTIEYNSLDMYLVKLNQSGFILWDHILGSKYFDEFYSVSIFNENEVYVTGVLTDHNFNYIGLLQQYNSSGFNNWNYTWNEPSQEQDITVDSTDSIIIADGKSIKKINSSGISIWNSTLANSSSISEFVRINSNNDIYIAASRTIPCIDNSFFMGTFCICTGIYLSKLNSSGNLLWDKRCTGCIDAHCNDIAIDTTGNVYISGTIVSEGGCVNSVWDALIMKNPKKFEGVCIEIYYDLIFLILTPIVIIGIVLAILFLHKRKGSKSK